MAYDLRDGLRTLTLAQAAQEGPWQLPIRMQAEVKQQEALGLAMVGETVATVITKLDDARAEELLSGVLATGTSSRRDAGFFGARHSAALALCGEPDEAARVGLASLKAATATSSHRTRRVLSEVAERLAPWSSRPAVQSFRVAVRD